MNVIASRKNTSATAPVVLREATNMYVVKIAPPQRKRPIAAPACSAGIESSKNVTSAQNEIQKAPNDVKATAPNVLPVRNSHMPASSWAMPPYASASPSTTGLPGAATRSALNMLSTNVVSANAARPKGPGSATFQPPAASTSR